MVTLFVHIVTFNHEGFIEPCLSALLQQVSPRTDFSVQVVVTDNASTDDTLNRLAPFSERGIILNRSGVNLGFSAAHNWGVARFLESEATIFVALNPDVALEPHALHELVEGLERWPNHGAATGLLLRSDHQLRPLNPEIIDSAGMLFTRQFRHFDRFAECAARAVTVREEEVEGATGAFLAVRRSFVTHVALDAGCNESVYQLYPALRSGASHRYPLFDEAFFAYREDAELSLRARMLGERFVLLPLSRGAHHRRVTPERRKSLSAQINKLGVRNRFLLQASLFSLRHHWRWLLEGVFLRNVIVFLGVVLQERSSVGAFKEFFILLPRALARRRELGRKIRGTPRYF